MSERNREMIKRAVEEVWNRGRFDVVENYVSNDFVIHGSRTTGEIHGPPGVKAYFGMLRSAFPDLHFSVVDQIAEGDRVVTRWVAHGTHTGELQGIPPTGKRCTTSGIGIDRIADGRIVECWAIFDELGLMQQLGVVPEPEEAASH
jgi:steroid delta-isomerase-like uncharacterized protein